MCIYRVIPSMGFECFHSNGTSAFGLMQTSKAYYGLIQDRTGYEISVLSL